MVIQFIEKQDLCNTETTLFVRLLPPVLQEWNFESP